MIKKTVLVFFLLLNTAFCYGSSEKRVLLISSYHPGFPTFFQQVQGVKSVFDSKEISLDIEFMDTKRFTDVKNMELFKEMLGLKLEKCSPYDLIMTADDNAFLFSLKEKKVLFASKPIVFFGVNNLQKAFEMDKVPGITGVIEAVSMKETLDVIKKLHPKISGVTALSDATTSGTNDLNSFLSLQKDFPDLKLNCISLAQMTWKEFSLKLKKLNEDQGVLLLSAYKDMNGETVSFEEGLDVIIKAAQVPVYHLWEHGIGMGLAGGKVISHFDQGRAAAERALRILDGESIRDISVLKKSPNRFMFDFNVLERFNLPVADLPKDVFFINRPVSFYEINKKLIWGMICIFTLISGALIIALKNIFYRKKAEKSLAESESRYRTILETAFDGFWVVDTSGFIREVNQVYSEMSGYAPDEIVNMHVSQLEAFHDEALIKRNIQQAIEKGSITFESRHKRKDGILFDVEISIRCNQELKDIFIVFIKDITVKKEAEKERRKLHEQFVQMQKMDSVGRLAGGVAHDFNNMLSIIIGNAEILQEEFEESGNNLSGFVTEILRASERSADLTSQLLAFARKQAVSPKIIDLNQAIESSLKMLRRLIGEDIELIWKPAETIKKIRADKVQIDQILINLCINSRDSIDDTGSVTISTGSVFIDSPLDHGIIPGICGDLSCFTPSFYTFVSVKDSGEGMDSQTLGKIFEPFYTTKELGKGTGLGLSTVHGIVLQNQGLIKVESSLEKGSIFTVYFPENNSLDGKAKKIDMINSRIVSSLCILVAEDEKAVLEITKRMLESMGHTVITASSAEKAVSTALENRNKIELLITDVIMPEINGIELHKKIKAIIPDIQCLYISGYTDDIISEKGMIPQKMNLLNKPFKKTGLAEKIREIYSKCS